MFSSAGSPWLVYCTEMSCFVMCCIVYPVFGGVVLLRSVTGFMNELICLCFVYLVFLCFVLFTLVVCFVCLGLLGLGNL